MSIYQPKDRLIIALDVDTVARARDIVQLTKNYASTYKVGLEFFTAMGPAILNVLQEENVNFFLDLKLNDIPNTVAKAVVHAVHFDVSFLTVHAFGGHAMMATAKQALDKTSDLLQKKAPTLLAVTVLTHLSAHDLDTLGFKDTPSSLVIRLLEQAYHAGIRGCVCSPQEAPIVRHHFGGEFCVVCPGIRPKGSAHDDQTRICTPHDAIRNGADFLVVGRPIIAASDPLEVARGIVAEIAQAAPDIQAAAYV